MGGWDPVEHLYIIRHSPIGGEVVGVVGDADEASEVLQLFRRVFTNESPRGLETKYRQRTKRRRDGKGGLEVAKSCGGIRDQYAEL